MKQYKESDLTIEDIEYIKKNNHYDLEYLWMQLDFKMWCIKNFTKKFFIFWKFFTIKELAIKFWINRNRLWYYINKWNLAKALNITQYE